MKPWIAAGALLLSACGGGDAPDNGMAGAAPSPVPSTRVPVTPATTLPAGEGIPGVSAPAPAHPVEAEAGADAAVAVLRDYFAAIGAGRYADAYRLWNGRGEASGMSAKAFADSFGKYSSYTATIGTPGRIDAGAGQRYIEIPVMVDARLRDGSPAPLEGSMTLRRTGDIDGATAEQRSWRIADSGLKPRPAADTPAP